MDSLVPDRSSRYSWIAVIVGAAIVLSGVSVWLSKQALDGQATLTQDVQSLRQQLERSQATAPATSTTIQPAPKSAMIPSADPTIRLPNDSLEISGDQLQAEMETVVTELRNDFPNLAEALHVVALMKAQTRQYAEAQKLWDRCIQLDPKQELYYVNAASVAMERGDDDKAVATLQAAVKLGFKSFDVVHHLAIALSKLGKHDEVIPLITESLKTHPSAAAHWLLLGQAELESDNPKQAELHFRKAMELGANSPSVFMGLGNACARQGNRAEAAKHLKTYSEMISRDKLSGQERYQVLSDLEIRKTAATILTEAAMVYFRHKDLLQAERLLLRNAALASRDRSALRALADLYFKTKRLADERLVRNRIIELGMHQFSDLVDYAKVCAQMEDHAAAEAALKLAMTVYPDAIDAYAALAQFHVQSNRLDTAKWYAQQSIQRSPTAEGFRFLAKICQLQRDETGAAQALRFARELDGK